MTHPPNILSQTIMSLHGTHPTLNSPPSVGGKISAHGWEISVGIVNVDHANFLV